MSIIAFKIAEHNRCHAAVNINIDGFQLTHMVELLKCPPGRGQPVPSAVCSPRDASSCKTVTMGAFAMSTTYGDHESQR